jgi:hypothetical protein
MNRKENEGIYLPAQISYHSKGDKGYSDSGDQNEVKYI